MSATKTRPQQPSTQRRAITLAPLLLGACAAAPSRVGDRAPPVAARPAAPAGALDTERQWLQAWFRDTPVRIVEAEDGGLAVTVPREFSFNPGRSEVRPPLAAVLDKVAESLRRSPTLRLSLLAAPGDGSARSVALALERARQVQRHLRSRGVAPARLGTPTGGAAAAMQLRLADGSASP